MINVAVEPIDQDIGVMIDDLLSPAAQSAALADYARSVEKETEADNQQALGFIAPHVTIVDGTEGASEDRVRPDGTIVYEFTLLNDLFAFIDQMLIEHSPVKSGRYDKSHELFADGVVIDPNGEIPPASEYYFANTQPYARKIEEGESSAFPDGVYQGIATLAKDRFDNLATISFDYRALSGAPTETAHPHHHGRVANPSEWLSRQPAIVITVK